MSPTSKLVPAESRRCSMAGRVCAGSPHRRDVSERDVRDLLTDELAVGGDADQHLATFAVQERTERLAGAPKLGGLGLALGDERLKGGEGGGHDLSASTAVNNPRPK